MALWEDSTYHRVLVPTMKPYSLAAVLTKDFFFFINLLFDSNVNFLWMPWSYPVSP